MKKIILAGIILSVLAGCGKDPAGEYISTPLIYCIYPTTFGDDSYCCTTVNANDCPIRFNGYKLQDTDPKKPNNCAATNPCPTN